MQSDRELLELAAKAAGYGLPGPNDHDEIGRQELNGLWVKFPWGWGWWRPLYDDGDALRLAVKLGITMQQNFGGVLCYDNPDFADKSQKMIEVYENKRPDPYAATRRAIVRAAAEIGRSMK